MTKALSVAASPYQPASRKKPAGFSLYTAALAAAMIFAAPSSLSAQAVSAAIPEEMLVLGKKECMQGCLAENDMNTCEQLCGCSMQQFKKRVSFPRYLDLMAQLSSNDVSAESRALMDDIARTCADAYFKAVAEKQASLEKETSSPETRSPAPN